AEAAGEYDFEITIAGEGEPAEDALDASSVLSLMGLGAEYGHTVVLRAEGDGAEEALAALKDLIEPDHDAEQSAEGRRRGSRAQGRSRLIGCPPLGCPKTPPPLTGAESCWRISHGSARPRVCRRRACASNTSAAVAGANSTYPAVTPPAPSSTRQRWPRFRT